MQIDFEALFASSPNPYVLMDRDLVLVWMNEAYLRTTMRARADLIGRDMFEAFPSDPASDSHRQLRGSFRTVFSTRQPDEIALIRYDIATPDGGMDVRYWSATHTPMLDGDGAVAFILQHTVDVTELHGLRTMRDEIGRDEMGRDEMGIVQRASAVQARNRDLTEEAQQLKTLFEQAPGFVAILSGPDHRFQMVNIAYRDLIGQRNVVGKTLAEALPEVVAQGFVDLLDEVRRTGIPYIGRAHKVLLDNARLRRLEERYLDFVYQPIVGEDGEMSGVFVQGHDVTEQVEAEERQKLLINELNHRVKNTLAIVQGLAMQSFRTTEATDPARQTFEARLAALSAAHSLLTRRNWEDAHLLDTVRSSVDATAGTAISRFHFSGPDFALLPQTAVSLAMVIHELGTNAIKYGALASETGQVEVRWTIEEDGNDSDCLLTFDWIESGGPPVTPPARTGFGTRLIKRGVSTERASRVAMDFLPEGLRCTIVAHLPGHIA